MSKIKLTNILKIINCLILILVLFPTSLFADDNSFQWQIGEELTYKVKWSFIRLGTLKLQVCDTLTIDSTFVYHIKLFIDSNPTLFFVNMHNVYETFIDEQFRLFLFLADEKIDNIKYETRYRFNYADSIISIKLTDINDATKIIEREEPLNESIVDGTAMIFYARSNAAFTKHDTLTSFFESIRGKVVINFKGRAGKVKIRSLPYKMETYFVDGRVHMKGIAGLKGPFKGWFAVDNKRPPLKAMLKVFIGHVKVELESWEKWNPVLTK